MSPLLKPEVDDVVTAYINDRVFTGTISLASDGYLAATVTDGTDHLVFNRIEPGIEATIVNPSSLTGTLRVMVKTKKFDKMDYRYLPICSIEGDAFNSINLNNSPNAKATAPISTAAAYGKATELGAFATNIGEASGLWTFANGGYSKAKGLFSHAEGYHTIANGESQHTEGKYNIEDTENKYAHIVGNGGYLDSNNIRVRSNAYTLDWSGNAWFAGSVEGTSIILSSPDGSRFNITVNNDGQL